MAKVSFSAYDLASPPAWRLASPLETSLWLIQIKIKFTTEWLQTGFTLAADWLQSCFRVLNSVGLHWCRIITVTQLLE